MIIKGLAVVLVALFAFVGGKMYGEQLRYQQAGSFYYCGFHQGMIVASEKLNGRPLPKLNELCERMKELYP